MPKNLGEKKKNHLKPLTLPETGVFKEQKNRYLEEKLMSIDWELFTNLFSLFLHILCL